MRVETNAPYPNRIQLLLDNPGPLQAVFQDGPLGGFDPRRDLEVYVDGTLTTVSTFTFDVPNNRYLLYTQNAINLQGVIQVIHHMPNPPFQFSLSAIATLTPNPVAFGSHVEGTTSAAMAVTLTNTGGTALTGITPLLTGSNPSDFALTTGVNVCGTSLDAGDSCNFYVTFTPSAITNYSATLSVSDNAYNSPQATVLTGAGTAPLAPLFQYVSTAVQGGISSTFASNSAGNMIVAAFVGVVNSEVVTSNPFLTVPTFTDSAGNVYTQYATGGTALFTTIPIAYFGVYVCPNCVASTGNIVTVPPTVDGQASFESLSVEYGTGGHTVVFDAFNCPGEDTYCEITTAENGELAVGLGAIIGLGSVYFSTTAQSPSVTMRYPQVGSSPPTSSPFIYQDCITGAAGNYQQYFTGNGTYWFAPFLVTIKAL